MRTKRKREITMEGRDSAEGEGESIREGEDESEMDSSEGEDESVMNSSEGKKQPRMANKLFKAAIDDDFKFFDKNCSRGRGRGKEYFGRKTLASHNNILHIALRHGSWKFAREAWKRFPDLMWEGNSDGNTPLHLAVGIVKSSDVTLLFVEEVCGELAEKSPLRIQNSMGNTLLHMAIIHTQFDVAQFLVEKDPSLAEIVNKSMEAPLHLALQHFTLDEEKMVFREEIKEEIFAAGIKIKIEANWAEGINQMWHDVERSKLYCMGVLIRLLLEKAPYVATWRDASGLSPFHRAASLPTFYNLVVVKTIIECCPQSIEARDRTGKTILHHLVNRIDDNGRNYSDFLYSKPIDSLVNCQDEQGDTAGHLAAISKDINMLRKILDMPNFNMLLRNNGGETTATLSTCPDLIEMMTPTMTKEMCDAAEEADVEALWKMNESLGLTNKKDPKGRNIFHKLFEIKAWQIIIPDKMFDLLDKCAERMFVFEEGDINGDTPSHVFARLNLDTIMIYMATGPRDCSRRPYEGCFIKPCLRHSFREFYLQYDYDFIFLGETDYYKQLLNWWLEHYDVIGLEKNANGNTALHEALIAKNYSVFTKLAEHDKCETTLVNNCHQTLLHLLVTLNPMPQVREDVMENIIKNNTKEERHFYNEDGVHLVTLAIQAGNIEFAAKLCSLCPRIAAIVDPAKCQTFWHQLVDLPPIPSSFNFAESSFTDEAVCHHLKTKDKKGNTALHLAIKSHRFDLAVTFLGPDRKLHSNGTPVFQKHLLDIPNIEGLTPADMIGELSYVPRQFEDFMGKVSTMIGIRSRWGIPTTQMKDYVNTMGVIAALLTTITFTAAFAVPGGFDQEKGTPLLMSEPSFKVFIFFDIIAMCLSMMVLFCLLLIMATDKKSKAVVLLDSSIILVQASFYTTLVTFMTGLYATIHTIKLGVAVFALVLCSMLILLMQKFLVMNLIIPSGEAVLIFFEKGFRNARKWPGKIQEIYRRQGNSTSHQLFSVEEPSYIV